MKKYNSSDIRNFAIVGHGTTGKTTLAEAMLVCGKEINRMGTVEAGNTVSDFSPGERDRQISIHAVPLHMEWQGTKFNMIDAPGYSDFIGETTGNLDLAGIVGSYIGLFMLSSIFTSIGIFASSLSNNQIIAFILAIIISTVFYFGFDLLSKISTF